MREVYYTQYLSTCHLKLIEKRWKELHCLLIDGEVWVKMVSP